MICLTVLAIYGGIGKGKNTFAVFLGRKLYQANKGKLTIYSNFHINEPYAKYVTIDQFIKIPDTPDKKLAILDEPYAWGFDSRRSSSGTNISLTMKILQSRHYNMDVIFLTQIPSSMDKRSRLLADYVIFAKFPSEEQFNYTLFNEMSNTVNLYLSLETAKKESFPFFNTKEIIKEAYSDSYLISLRGNE